MTAKHESHPESRSVSAAFQRPSDDKTVGDPSDRLAKILETVTLTAAKQHEQDGVITKYMGETQRLVSDLGTKVDSVVKMSTNVNERLTAVESSFRDQEHANRTFGVKVDDVHKMSSQLGERLANVETSLKPIMASVSDLEFLAGISSSAVREKIFQGKYEEARKIAGLPDPDGFFRKAVAWAKTESMERPANGLRSAAWGVGGTLAFDAACTLLHKTVSDKIPILGFALHVVDAIRPTATGRTARR